MKRISIILSLSLLLAVSACQSVNTLTTGKKVAQGAPYELLVVSNAPEWEGEVGDLLRESLEAPVEMAFSAEPSFTILRVTADDFKNMLLEHRNILKVIVSKKVDKAQVAAKYDVASAPQIVLSFQGPTRESLIEYLKENGDKIRQVLEMAERDRTVKYARKFPAPKINSAVKKKFGVDVCIPKGYELRSESENFLWASYEFPVASQGFFIYTFPYKDRSSLSAENLVLMRSQFAQRIPGPADGSFMTTVTQVPNADDTGYIPFTPDQRMLEINGCRWVETRGLWDVENYFMGGPYVSYATVDRSTGMVFVLDCYVYSPKHGKRNYLRALEHLVYLVSMPDAK